MTDEKAQHTPVPWTWENWFDPRGNNFPYLQAADGRTVQDQPDTVDGQFILRACNAHDDLLAALAELRDRTLTLSMNEKSSLAEIGRALYDIADAAIAKAKGQAGES